MNGKFQVKTWHSFLIAMGFILFGFVWNTFYADSPFKILVGSVEVLFFGYALKRTAQKLSVLGGQSNDKEDAKLGSGGPDYLGYDRGDDPVDDQGQG